MKEIMKISIELENNTQLSYFAGSQIGGFVILDISNPAGIKSNGVIIKCTGESKVEWRNEHTKSAIYVTDHEVYFIFQKYLIGSQDGPELTIPSGIQRFPFEFTLPRNMPSSFVGDHGRVQYFIQATLKRSWKFDAKTRLDFNVNGIVDLNTIPSPIPNVHSIAQPAILKNETNRSIFCCNSRPIRFKLRVNQLGFVSGQSIVFDLAVTNLSNSRVRSASVYFYQGVTYTVRNRSTKFQKKLLEKIRFGEVEAGNEQKWTNFEFKLPSLPPTTTGLGAGVCKLISIKYWIEVYVSSLISSVSGALPLVIGNTPLVPIRQIVAPITRNAITTNGDDSNIYLSAGATRNTPLNNIMSATSTNIITTGSTLEDDDTNLALPSYEDVVAGNCPSYEESQSFA